MSEMAKRHLEPAVAAPPVEHFPEGSPTSAKRANKPPPTTLTEYFSAGLRARAVHVVAPPKGAGGAIDDDDFTKARALIGERDPKLRKLFALTREAAERNGSERARRVLAFSGLAVGDALAVTGHPAALDAELVTEALSNVARTLGPRLSTPRSRDQARNLLLSATLVLATLRDLDADQAIVTLQRALPPPGLSKTLAEVQNRIMRVAYLTGPGTDDPARLIEFVAPWRQGESLAREQAERARARTAALEDEVRRLGAQVAEGHEQLLQLQNDVAERGRDVVAVRREAETATAAHRIEREALQRELRAVLSRSLKAAEVAAEAASLDPPRAHVVREQLDHVIHALTRETSKLSKSGSDA